MGNPQQTVPQLELVTVPDVEYVGGVACPIDPQDANECEACQ